MSTCKSSHCVCEKVREIVIAQDRVSNDNNDCCTTGCDRSIEDLLSPVANNSTVRETTIPIVLYCKGDCEPFFGSGISQELRTPPGEGRFNFECVETPVFRAKKFDEDNECCVQLELLEPVNAGGQPVNGADTVCSFFGENTRDLRATGLCITVDLNCFCAITCLDPITPMPAQ